MLKSRLTPTGNQRDYFREMCLCISHIYNKFVILSGNNISLHESPVSQPLQLVPGVQGLLLSLCPLAPPLGHAHQAHPGLTEKEVKLIH